MKTSNTYLNYYRSQAGYGLPVYASPILIQRGRGWGSMWRSVVNFFKPAVRAAAPIAKSLAPAIGKELLASGKDLVGDVIAGKNIGESVKQRMKEAGSRSVGQALQQLHGSGHKRRSTLKSGHLKKRPRAVRKRRRVDVFD